MDEDLHNIDDLFKKAINEHEEMPSNNAWEQIDKNLDKKKVIFISQKYNRLKWIAAALLVFSAGMAMYTWHTKIKNKELVKQSTVNSRKENNFKNNKNNNTVAEESLSNKNEEKKTIKDTAALNNQALNLNENKNKKKLEESKKTNTIFPFSAVKNLKDVAETEKSSKENKEKSKQSFGQQLVKSDKSAAEKKTGKTLISANDKSLSASNEQKNALENNLYISKERPRKEAVAVTELPKHKFYIEPENASLQKLPVTSKQNNKIAIQEKPIAAIKINKSKISIKSLFSVTVFYSPDVVASKVDNERHNFREEERNEIKNKEDIRNTYSAGVLVDYNAGKRISIQSGLSFSSIATHIQPKTIYARPDNQGNVNYRFNCSAGYSYVSLPSGIRPSSDGDSISALSSKNILNYITLPLVIKYKLSKGKFSLSPGLGIAVNFLTKGTIETVIGSEKANINHIEGISKMYLNSAISAGINYDINKKIALNLTPAARFALTSINKDAPFKTYLNSCGLAAGLTIKL